MDLQAHFQGRPARSVDFGGAEKGEWDGHEVTQAVMSVWLVKEGRYNVNVPFLEKQMNGNFQNS